ncbi:MAG TPA: nucleoside-diphosphate kinase [Bacteroidales bacterium]|nr:nucleoside-diphosphate kinase [Bacteroidales bacterium]
MEKCRITLTLIKPYAVKHGFVGPILARINEAGFRISAMKYLQLSLQEAERFYEVHRGQPFFVRLTRFMSNGPIVAAILEKENAVIDYRKLIGATDPKKADEGTLRKLFGASIEHNAVHGSDSNENAVKECNFFFSELERF